MNAREQFTSPAGGDLSGSAGGEGIRPPAVTGSRTGTVRAVVTLVLGALAGIWALVMAGTAVSLSRVTYYLPPSPGHDEATAHHEWDTGSLWLTSLPAIALVIALAAVVLSVIALARRRASSAWRLLLPIAALALATLGPVIILAMPSSSY